MEGGLITRDFEIKVRFCFIRRPCFFGAPRDKEEKALETGRSHQRGHVEEP
jgi:hypothetical protein